MKNNLSRFLVPKMQNNPAWREFAELAEDMLKEHVWPQINELRNFMDPRKVQEEMISILGATLGFEMKSDLFDEEQFRRLIGGLAKYYEQSGTRPMAKFLSYTVDAKFEIREMWTEDYQKFYPGPRGSLLYEGGSWWRTPHVDLRYDSSTGILDSESLTELFYILAPIHLVLDGVVELIKSTGTAELKIVGAQIERIMLYTDPDGRKDIFYNDYMEDTFRRNNCPLGEEGTTVTHYIAAGVKSSEISKEAANFLARQTLDSEGQNKANSQGSCLIVHGFKHENNDPIDFFILESGDTSSYADRFLPE